MGNIEQTPQVKAPLFESKNIDGYITIDDNSIKRIYKRQFPKKDQTIDVKIMRKELNKEFSRHRIYFDGDFEYKNKLDELEQVENMALKFFIENK